MRFGVICLLSWEGVRGGGLKNKGVSEEQEGNKKYSP